MRVKDLRIVVAICRTGSFSKAAEALRITQPAVSQAVKRVETDLQIRIFERASSPITLSNEGTAAVKSIEKVIELIDGIRANGRDGARTRLGVTPLLSGRDVARLLNRSFEAHRHSFDVEFLDSSILSSRADFDAKIVMPSLRRRSSLFIDLMTVWIGVRNGVFIYSRQEADVWEQARLVLQSSSIPVDRVIEVNDCGYAYHMAASGAGFSPCVLTAENGFREHQLVDMPALPNVRLDIFASSEFGRELKANLLGS